LFSTYKEFKKMKQTNLVKKKNTNQTHKKKRKQTTQNQKHFFSNTEIIIPFKSLS